MKKIYGFAALAATLALGACSSEEPNVQPGNSSENLVPGGYLAVNVVAPTGTRAAVDGFEQGTEAESAVSSAYFLLFDKDGEQLSMQSKALDDNNLNQPGPSDTPHLSHVWNAVLVVGSEPETEGAPATGVPAVTADKLLVVLNITEAQSEALKNKSLSEVTAIVANYEAEMKADNSDDPKPLVMSNSAYKNLENQIVTAVPISGNISTTYEGAFESPVEVFVDRVTAKVVYADDADGFNISGTDVTLQDGTASGTEGTLTPRIDGYYLANKASESYLVKNIDNSWGNGFYDFANRRSYWALMPAAAQAAPTDAEDSFFKNLSWKDHANKGTSTSGFFYTQENTSAYKTSFLIAATLMTTDATGKEVPANIVKYAGQYYSYANFQNQIAQNVANRGFRVTNTTSTGDNSQETAKETIAANCFKMSNQEGNKSYKTYSVIDEEKLKETYGENVKIVSADGAESSITAINNYLKSDVNQYFYWNEGKCYYFLNIGDQLLAEGFKEGIVRNHIYAITLQSLKGLGTPVFDPDKVIIPEKWEDNDQFFVAATVKANSWKWVEQNLNLDFGK